jgi:hypothetical protein
MAAENWSRPISKTFEQIVYFSTSVTGYQTKKIWSKIMLIISFSVSFLLFKLWKKLHPNIPIEVKNATPFPRVLCLLVQET